MDNSKETARLWKTTTLLLKGRCLKQAIENMRRQLSDLQEWSLSSRLDEIETSYSYMLQYFRQGVSDTGRIEMHNRLIGKAILLNDDIRSAILCPTSSSQLYQEKRRQQAQTMTYRELDASLQDFAQLSNPTADGYMSFADAHEKVLSMMFRKIWASGLWSRQEYEDALGIVSSPLILNDDRMLAVSAVTLSIFGRFDPLKFQLLAVSQRSEETGVAQRALTGLALAAMKYEDILQFFPETHPMLAAVADQPDIRERMIMLQMALLLTRETVKLENKMKQEIIPNLLKNPKLGSVDIEEALRNDPNPEWKTRIEEISEMQMQGADVYMATFSHMKNYSFFNEPGNWFRPFDMDQPDVRRALGDHNPAVKDITNVLLASPMFCNSDKYSFCMMFQSLPTMQRDSMLGHIVPPEADISEMSRCRISPEMQLRRYIQDLYRFYKVHPYRTEFWDPFSTRLDLIGTKPLKPLIFSTENIRSVATYLLEKEYYTEACSLFKLYMGQPDAEMADSQLYQKMGYAFQNSEEYSDAIEAYIRADILDPDNTWTLMHTASCYRLSGDNRKALETYLHLERLAPEDINVQFHIGESLAAEKDYAEALKRFFKVFYLKPQSKRALRAIAWYSLLSKDTEQAVRYYSKLLDTEKPNAQDYLNAGHAQLVSGNMETAIMYYRNSLSAIGTDEFLKFLRADAPTLASLGIEKETLPLIIDLII